MKTSHFLFGEQTKDIWAGELITTCEFIRDLKDGKMLFYDVDFMCFREVFVEMSNDGLRLNGWKAVRSPSQLIPPKPDPRRVIYYYGLEYKNKKKGEIPDGFIGVYSHVLKPEEDETKVREEIRLRNEKNLEHVRICSFYEPDKEGWKPVFKFLEYPTKET